MDAAVARFRFDTGRAGHFGRTRRSTPSGFQNAPPIRAHCSDCHAHDGRDLKYFAFSNASIIARSRFHGLSESAGPADRKLHPLAACSQPRASVESPLSARTWIGCSAGRQLGGRGRAVMGARQRQRHTPFIFRADGDRRAAGELDWSALVPLITREPFRPDGNLNPREIPISLQLPDWNHWLPRVHPLDAWGPAFQNSEFSEWYGRYFRRSLNSLCGACLASPDLSALISSGRIVTLFR